jgi:oxygen-independent coproporphyrinogen-3 oxidase
MPTAISPIDCGDRTTSFATPRAAYIHVPFCRHRCGYCNFTLVAGRGDLVDSYLAAIARELETQSRVGTAHQVEHREAMNVGSAQPTPREVDTLYFGGGTPTYLAPGELRQLADTVLRWHPLADSESSPNPSLQGRGTSRHEWTVEANPSDVDQPMADVLAELGVTRVSLGAQSFRAEKLRLLERDHDAQDIERAVRVLRAAGMKVALDLIFAAPGETLAQWASDLDVALALEPDHVSTYGLTFERGTAFWNRRSHGQLSEVDEEVERAMYALAIERLTAAGLEHYEVSNFALPGQRSRHNQAYWSGDGYWAAGPGAARYVDGVRETNHRSTTTYLKRVLAGESPVADREQLSAEARARELLVFGLRRIDGVSRREFAARTGCEFDSLVAEPLRKFVGLGLLADDGERVKLTREGLFVSDAIWPEML